MLTVIDIINRVLGYFNVADKPKGKAFTWVALIANFYLLYVAIQNLRYPDFRIRGALFMLAFVVFLKKKINEPLNLLCLELNNFESGESKYTSYCGPKEFVKIFDSFYSLSQRLRQSEEERKKLEAGRQKMLADISHDLRTPISVVQGYAKALCDGVIPIEQQPQYLEIICLLYTSPSPRD